MKKSMRSEKLLLEELSRLGRQLRTHLHHQDVGKLIKLLRQQFKMSQEALAQRCGVPQSMISRLERQADTATLTTLFKVFQALSCDFVVVPVLGEPIDTIKYKQARHLAEQRINYLKGTMNLEEQQPDPQLLEELIEETTQDLLRAPGTNLWKR